MWSTMATVSKLLLNTLGNFQVLCVSSLLAALTMLAINLFSGKLALLKTYRLKDYLTMTGVFSMGIGNTAWALAMEKGNTAKISNLAYITPFLSLIWTALILKEAISIWSVVGLCVIVLGVFVQLKDSKK